MLQVTLRATRTEKVTIFLVESTSPWAGGRQNLLNMESVGRDSVCRALWRPLEAGFGDVLAAGSFQSIGAENRTPKFPV